VNPVIIVVLNTLFMAVLPPRPLRMSGRLMLVLILGTVLQAAAVWLLVGSQTQGALIAFLCLFSLGEAMAYPRKKPFHVQFAPQHGLASFQSLAAFPLSLVGYAFSWTSGPLLDTSAAASPPRPPIP
jgi:energy-coupling factor transporter transmembrane protein EcfT